MEAEAASWLEVVLRRHSLDRSVARVLALEESPALGPGEANFMSQVDRVRAGVMLGSGGRTARSFLVKKRRCFESTEGRACEPGYKLFFNSEILVYEEILPPIERLLRQSGDPDPLWPQLVGCIRSQLVCFTDLKAEGFRVGCRLSGLDLDHALLVVQSLAKLHAASAVALLQGILDPSTVPAYYPARKEPAIEQLYSNYFDLLCDVIAQHWSHEWQPLGKRLREEKKGIIDSLADLYNTQTSLVKVLNHGDLWVNNIMFKYYQNKPYDLRFVDFQTVHYNTSGWDLVYFLYTSVRPYPTGADLDVVLRLYLDSFRSTLAALGSDLEPPSLADLRTDLARLKPFALVLAVSILPVLLSREGQAHLETEDLFLAKTVEKRRPLFLNPDYVELLKHILTHTLN